MKRSIGSVGRHGKVQGRSQFVGPNGNWTKRDAKTGVFVGPSVEGVDKEYVKVVSGKVTDRKPSFT